MRLQEIRYTSIFTHREVTHAQIEVQTCTHIHTLTPADMHVLTYAHRYPHSYTHVFTQVRTHVHTHTLVQLRSLPLTSDPC